MQVCRSRWRWSWGWGSAPNRPLLAGGFQADDGRGALAEFTGEGDVVFVLAYYIADDGDRCLETVGGISATLIPHRCVPEGGPCDLRLCCPSVHSHARVCPPSSSRGGASNRL